MNYYVKTRGGGRDLGIYYGWSPRGGRIKKCKN